MNKFKLFLISGILIMSVARVHSEVLINNTEHFSFTITVVDSADSSPIQSARVSLMLDSIEVETLLTNMNGRAEFKDLDAGRFGIRVYADGYDPFRKDMYITDTSSNIAIFLSELSASTDEITIVGEREEHTSSVDIKTGDVILESSIFKETPSARISQIVQQNLAGAVKAPTGEIHINGEHGEFSYYIDGIQIPLGVFGGLNEVIDPQVIDRATFINGGYAAEYGGQIAGIIDINSRVPADKFHIDFSSYVGSFFVLNGTKPFSPGKGVSLGHSSSVTGDTLGGMIGPFRSLNSNGQSLSLSDHYKKLSFFVAGSRQETDRRIDQPVITLFNDHGFDYFLYGNFDYLINKTDYLTANLNYGKTVTQVPFDSITQGYSPDNQITSNSFQTVSYFHTFSEKKNHESSFFAGLYSRQGSLRYNPSPYSPVNFQFRGDSTTYALTTDRNFSTYGLRTKYVLRISKTIKSYAGIELNSTYGNVNFTSRDSSGHPGPSFTTKYNGSDFGVFAQGEWHPYKVLKLDAGLRYDQHIAPDIKLQNQLSPRIKLNFFPDEMSSAYLYYGKLFIPTNIEGLRTIASNVSNSNIPTVPERADFFELSVSRNFKFGLVAKLSAFRKNSNPGIDDQTIGASSIKTTVNIASVKTTGIELTLSYRHPKLPVSGYINTSLIHAYGSGQVTGGFLDIYSEGSATDLDHDQRLSISAGINYQPKNWFINLSSIYGSGLTNGNSQNTKYGTGLFDFNSSAHVSPYIVFSLGGGYTFNFKKGYSIEPSLYITNLFDRSYILKGAYFSAASYGERRNVTFRLNFHM